MLTAEAIVARAHALVHAHAKLRRKVFRIPLPPVIAILVTDPDSGAADLQPRL